MRSLRVSILTNDVFARFYQEGDIDGIQGMLRHFNLDVRTLAGFVLADMCKHDSKRLWAVVAHAVSEAHNPDLQTARSATCALNAVLESNLFAVLDEAIDKRTAELEAERGEFPQNLVALY